jgi:hypothetical protein
MLDRDGSMADESTHSRRWQVVSLVGAVLYAGHGLFFDWSDVAIHSAIALAAIVASVRWPRGAALSLLFLQVLVFVVRVAVERTVIPSSLAPGIPLSEARQILGAPSYEFWGFEEATHRDLGYSRPSPLRFSHHGPVAIFVRGEHVIWLLHDGETVIAVFVGGT